MIKASELRIGNVVHATTAGDPHAPLKEYVIQCGKDIDYCDWWFPIDLTEYRLSKFGFSFLKKKSGTQGVYTNGKMNLYVSNCGNIYRLNKCLPYVHTLQNLYFALTSQELNANKI